MKEMANKTNVNITGLLKYAEKKKKLTIDKVEIAIKNIIKSNGNINFNSISQVSGVSKAYLYKNTEIRERIEALRNQGQSFGRPKYSKKEMTESSKDVVIAAKNKKIKELEQENKYLKEQLMLLRGKLYDSI